MEPRYVWQLVAEGEALAGCRHAIRSSTVFTSEEAAKQRIPQMRQMVTDPKRLMALTDDETLTITAKPLEIVE